MSSPLLSGTLLVVCILLKEVDAALGRTTGGCLASKVADLNMGGLVDAGGGGGGGGSLDVIVRVSLQTGDEEAGPS
jgi:hypothetical protein